MSSQRLANTSDALAVVDGLRAELAPIMSENGQSFDRLRTVFNIAIQQNPDILKCTPDSLRRELSKCAADGLVPDSKEAVLLPYYDKDAKAHLANYQPMVHGVIKRLRELGSVFTIICNLVYANDTYEENEADPDSLIHRSPGFYKPRGEIVGGYVIFKDDQKRVMHFEKMSRDAFDRVRQASKSSNSPAWTKWYEEMCRKAVLRRGSKYLSTNNDKIRALIERQDAMFDLNARPAVERFDPFTGQVIEHGMPSASAIENNSSASVAEDRAQDRQPAGGQTTASAVDQHEDARSEDKQPDAKSKKVVPPAPKVPDITVRDDHREIMIDCAEKVLGIALEQENASKRKDKLKAQPEAWKPELPEYLHPLLRACIEMTDWSIKRDAEGVKWTADHAQFTYGMKTLLGVEKLNVGRYP